MDERSLNDVIALLERSERILLVTHRKPDGDAIGSLMGLSKILQILGKEVVSTCSDQVPERFSFFPNVSSVQKEVPGAREFVVTLDCDKTEVDRLKYHLEDNKIHIVITPKKGRFFEKNVTCTERSDAFDLIVTVDVADIPQLGRVYDENKDLFTSLPVINIDHHASNTNFGKLNMVIPSASSTSEILYDLIQALEKHFQKELMTKDVATFLLSGVTTDTGSFQNANTTPKSMEIAADLMDKGASHQDIIKFLFRTKKLPTLKLWGKILTKIEVDKTHRIVWSSVTQEDFTETGTTSEDTEGIIDELLVHAPEAEMVALFKEEKDLATGQAGMASVSLRSKSGQVSVMEVAKLFGGGGHVQAAGIKMAGKTLPEVMPRVISAMQDLQRKRLKLEEKKEEPKITQVLEGYTEAMPEEKSVAPTLEERQTSTPTSSLAGEGGRGSQDIHDKTKAAIMAEHSQPTNGAMFSPSKSMGGQKPAARNQFPTPPTPPTPPKPPTPPAPPKPATRDQRPADQSGVIVKPAPAPLPKAPVVPQVPKVPSSEPTVKIVPPAPKPPNPFDDFGGLTPPATSNQPASGGQPPSKPDAPKDPFAIGDDGMTDIERALGGL